MDFDNDARVDLEDHAMGLYLGRGVPAGAGTRPSAFSMIEHHTTPHRTPQGSLSPNRGTTRRGVDCALEHV